MQRYDRKAWPAAVLGIAVLLCGCGGLEKGPAPNLPYTPEPPAPKTEKKADTPKSPGPSASVPIRAEPLAPSEKKETAQNPAPETADANSPAAIKDEVLAPEAKKDQAPKADELKPAEPAQAEPKK